MKLIEACDSLKLECALREVGFVTIGWMVVAHAGIYFIEPVGLTPEPGPHDDLLGFMIERHLMKTTPNDVRLLAHSAKDAFEMTEMMGEIEDWDF